MSAKILKCKECSTYTMKETCGDCDAPTTAPHPSRFSPEDRYGKYRRKLHALAKEESPSLADAKEEKT